MEETNTKSMGSTKHNVFYSATASSLNKRPIGEIMEEEQKKKGVKKQVMKPHTKKTFTKVTSKLDTGVKKSKVATSSTHQSDALTFKMKEEMFGRLPSEHMAKFLTQRMTQGQFIRKVKGENKARLDDKGTDFNFTD